MNALTCYCGREFPSDGAYTRHVNLCDGSDTTRRPAEVDKSVVWDTPIPGPWVEDGVCASVDTDIFFPESGGNESKRAKAICSTCPVIDQCREYAMANPQVRGIWGGTSWTERYKARKGAAA